MLLRVCEGKEPQLNTVGPAEECQVSPFIFFFFFLSPFQISSHLFGLFFFRVLSNLDGKWNVV